MNLRAFLFGLAIPLLLVGCSNGNSGGSGGVSAATARLYRGPLMYAGAQLRIYSDYGTNWPDLNGDGFIDYLAVGPRPGHRFDSSVYLSLASDTEIAPEPVFLGDGGSGNGLVSADFNSDGLIDIALLVPSGPVPGLGQDIAIAFQQPNGTFTEPGALGVDAQGSGLLTGDINGDGHADLLLGRYFWFDVFIGMGDGTFEQARHVDSAYNNIIACMDLNNDGLDDVIEVNVTQPDGHPMGFLISHGDGTFEEVLQGIGSRNLLLPPATISNDAFPDFVGTVLGGARSEIPGMIYTLLGDTGALYDRIVQTYLPAGFEGCQAGLLADLNEDGLADLAFSNTVEAQSRGQSERVISWYVALSRGDGSFRMPPIPLPYRGDSLTAAGDFDRDGHVDLLVSDGVVFDDQSSLHRIIPGNGDGTFRDETPPQLQTTGAPLRFIRSPGGPARAIDLTPDGLLDVVADTFTDDGNTEVSVLAGRGNGLFRSERRTLLEPDRFLVDAPEPIDLDDDGDLDLFGIYDYGGLAAIVRNYRGGRLEALPPTPTFASPFFGVNVASDFDGDGHTDVATASDYPFAQIMFGRGNLEFDSTPVDIGSVLYAGAGDVDGDGLDDVVGFVPNFDEGTVAGLVVARNAGNREFEAPLQTDLVEIGAQVSFQTPVFSDLTEDGRIDAVVTTYPTVDPFPQISRAAVYYGQPDGTFALGDQLVVPGGELVPIVVDLNLDGHVDLAIMDRLNGEIGSPANLFTFLNDGSGHFTSAGTVRLPVAPINRFEVHTITDVSGDRIPDLVAMGEEIGFAIAIGAGDGTFGPLHFFGLPVRLDAIVGDFDRDGDGDVAAIVNDDDWKVAYVTNRN